MKFALSKPFAKSMTEDPVTEIEVDFDSLTGKDYIECVDEAIREGETDMAALYKPAPKIVFGLLAKAVGCIPDMLNGMFFGDYQRLERKALVWFAETAENLKEVPDFSKITTAQYVAVRSRNAANEIANSSLIPCAKARASFIALATGRKQEELEALTAAEYVPLDVTCANFFVPAE